MSFSWLKCAVRYTIAVSLIAALPVGMWAQDAAQGSQAQTSQSLPQAPAPTAHRQFEVTDYTKSKGYFPNPIGPYTAREIPAPDLTNSPRMDQLVRDGKIYLSMDDAVALALEYPKRSPRFVRCP